MNEGTVILMCAAFNTLLCIMFVFAFVKMRKHDRGLPARDVFEMWSEDTHLQIQALNGIYSELQLHNKVATERFDAILKELDCQFADRTELFQLVKGIEYDQEAFRNNWNKLCDKLGDEFLKYPSKEPVNNG